MPDLHVLTSDQKPMDPDNNIVLTEVVRPGRGMEYTVTVLIDGTPVAVSGPFLTLDEAVDQANDQKPGIMRSTRSTLGKSRPEGLDRVASCEPLSSGATPH